MVFKFPSAEGVYDDFAFRLDGTEVPPRDDLSEGVTTPVELAAGAEATLEVGYRSRGLGPWTYASRPPASARCGTSSSTSTRTSATSTSRRAASRRPRTTRATAAIARNGASTSLVTGQTVGIDPPDRLNPGPLASRITFFAPVSLLFFFTVLVILGVLRGHSLHPMNYFFLAAAFFAFHLLLAYLVDHVEVHVAFGLAASP